MNLINQIILLLNEKEIAHKRGTYFCEIADQAVVVFRESETTGRVMLPMDLVLEWIQAYEFSLICLDQTAREMREIVSKASRWAPFQHGFETHLHSIVEAWAKNKFATQNES